MNQVIFDLFLEQKLFSSAGRNCNQYPVFNHAFNGAPVNMQYLCGFGNGNCFSSGVLFDKVRGPALEVGGMPVNYVKCVVHSSP